MKNQTFLPASRPQELAVRLWRPGHGEYHRWAGRQHPPGRARSKRPGAPAGQAQQVEVPTQAYAAGLYLVCLTTPTGT